MVTSSGVAGAARRPVPLKLATGAALIGLVTLAALASLVWTPVANPAKLRIGERLRPPFSPAGLLGTDQLGHDVLSHLMIGGQNSLAIAVLSIGLGGGAGLLIGLLAAVRGGRTDALLMRGMDVLFAFPPVLSALMLAAAFGGGRATAVSAIAVFTVPVFARVSRAGALRVLALDFVLAARAAGKRRGRIASEHVLPNIAGDLVVQASIQLGLAILIESGLSFLGLGPQPPAPSWGRMLAEGRTYLAAAPWLAIAPGMAIAAAVLGFTLLGDGLADRLDPKRRI